MSEATAAPRRRVFFIANCMYGTHVAGGDIHFFQTARAALAAGYEVCFFGGHALQHHLRKEGIPARLILTDDAMMAPINAESVGGQLRLLWDYLKRFVRTLWLLSKIRSEDAAYAVTDYWFDVWPVVFCRARRKLMIWHMQAPTLGQVICRARADVDAKRLASLYYWASQNLSLRLFCWCRNKHLYYINPVMLPDLLDRGYERAEVSPISFGVEVRAASAASAATKKYDVVWLGRVHRQKGIGDLVATLAHLAKCFPDFKAVIVGKVKAEIAPQLEAAGLSHCVELPGFVTDEQKWDYFRSSRVFLMPSRFEGAPRVIGEAIVCGVTVVAYALENYEYVYEGRLATVPCFDLDAFEHEAERQVRNSREPAVSGDRRETASFAQANSWASVGDIFLSGLGERALASRKGR